MSKNRISLVIAVLGVWASLAPLPLCAQKADKPTSSRKIGAVNVTFGRFLLKGSQGRFSAGVVMTSAQYDLAAEDVQATPASAKSGHSGLAGATAEGSAAKNTQVIAHIKQPSPGEEFKVFADHAVYVPDYSRPGGGRIDFTGHVKVVGMSGFLAGPAPGDFENGPVTILLGQGEDYPQLETGRGHIVVTPAQ